MELLRRGVQRLRQDLQGGDPQGRLTPARDDRHAIGSDDVARVHVGEEAAEAILAELVDPRIQLQGSREVVDVEERALPVTSNGAHSARRRGRTVEGIASPGGGPSASGDHHVRGRPGPETPRGTVPAPPPEGGPPSSAVPRPGASRRSRRHQGGFERKKVPHQGARRGERWDGSTVYAAIESSGNRSVPPVRCRRISSGAPSFAAWCRTRKVPKKNSAVASPPPIP